MFHHSLLLIIRNFQRFKSAFFINLAGLSSGLACTLLIYLWVNDELSMDKFHERDRQLYQVMRTSGTPGNIGTSGVTPGILAQALTEEMPEVQYAASAGLQLPENKTLSADNNDIKAKGMYAGKDFFKLFSFPLTQGNTDRVLTDPGSIVISEGLARKLFGTAGNVVGKGLEFNHEKHYVVSGVFKDTPANSSIHFDFVLPDAVLTSSNPAMLAWDNNYTYTYLLLKEGTDVARFNAKIAGLIERKSGVKHKTLFVRPFSTGYLYNKYENGVLAGGRIEYVKLFSIIAVVILVIACINFMNLSTAKATRRIREVGIKKAIGADRKTLIFQYLGESVAMAFVSLMTAILLVLLLLPEFNQITGKQITPEVRPDLVAAFLLITLFTGLLAGSYPALYLSGFRPVEVLKGKLNSPAGELWARKGLVIFQFTLSVIFIAGVLVVYKQIQYVQTKSLGYNKDNIIYFEKEGRAAKNLETFLAETRKIPGIADASGLLMNFVGAAGSLNQLEWEGKNPADVIEFEYRIVSQGFIEMLGIGVKEGRTFILSDKPDNTKIIFNEAAIAVMGLKNPVGKTVKFMGKDHQIVGVVKNFHFQSLHENVRPLFFYLLPDATGTVVVKLEAGKESEAIDNLRKFYQTYNPGFVFDYKFLDVDYQALYASEQRVSLLSKYFAGLAILISCLGLFGLAAFTAERRRKEIGIRKVLGASEVTIVSMLSGDFAKLVIAAILIGLPVSYLLTRQWLGRFAYKISLEPWYFLLAGGLALLVALLTVGLQAFRAAGVNPTHSLKEN